MSASGVTKKIAKREVSKDVAASKSLSLVDGAADGDAETGENLDVGLGVIKKPGKKESPKDLNSSKSLTFADVPADVQFDGDFQQFVATQIRILVSGQSRMETMLSGLSNKKVKSARVTTVEAAVLPGVQEAGEPVSARTSHEDKAFDSRKSKGLQEILDSRKSTSLQRDDNCASERPSQGGEGSLRKSAAQKSFYEQMSDHKDVEMMCATLSAWPPTLRTGWPKTLEQRHKYADDSEGDHHISNAVAILMDRTKEKGMFGNVMSLKSDASMVSSSLNSIVHAQELARDIRTFIFLPTHPARLFLDLISIICVCFDMITLPFFIAWDIEASGALRDLQLVVACYWTLDILLTFRTGYIRDGMIETNSRKIALNYLKGTFVFDMIVIVDWIGIIVKDLSTRTESTARLIRIGKLARLLRIVGVVRIAKASDILQRIAHRNVSQGALAALELIKLLVSIVYINHVIGCIWFAISKSDDTDTGVHWTDAEILGGGPYALTPLPFQYTTSLHWSLTQMTPGSMQVHAENTFERVFTIFCLVFGVLFFSSLVSALSAKKMEAKMFYHKKALQLSVMRTFLRERGVDSAISMVVQGQVIERMEAKKPMLQQDVAALTYVSVTLQAELHYTICQPFLNQRPLFMLGFRLAEHHASEMVWQSMMFFCKDKHDVLFTAGDDCNETYILTRGVITYTQKPETALVPSVIHRHVRAGDVDRKTDSGWLCEAALWSEWIHVGDASCDVVLEGLRIDANKFLEHAKKNLVLQKLLQDYAKAYHTELTCLVDPTDLCDESVKCEHLLSKLDPKLQVLVSLLSIQKILQDAWGWQLSSQAARFTRDEVIDGLATLVAHSDGSVHRCVHLSSLKLLRDDGYIFAYVGKWNEFERKVIPTVKLPGSKIKAWEYPADVLERVLTDDLYGIKAALILQHNTREFDWNTSGKYRIRTMYTKYITQARLNPAYTLPSPAEFSQQRSISGDRVAESRETGPFSRPAERVWDVTFYRVTHEVDSRVYIYAWMPPSVFELLTSPAGQTQVDQLLKRFDIANAIELNAEEIGGRAEEICHDYDDRFDFITETDSQSPEDALIATILD